MAPDRQRPEDFLELVERAKRGRLKIYIGPAAGVGKTYQMLEESHALKKRGVDVVLAFVETHGRTETEALIEGLEVIPRRHIDYRGVPVEEMDLEAVLKRHPQVAVVDELAHTNVPGSLNRKRYQDVLELLAAGINIICAFNIQHLESLNDLVKQATGVVVRETVPDSFLKQADQIVNLDLAVEDLIERLKAGKIYGQEKVGWALEHFFKPEKLTMLREIALREVAESIDRTVSSNARGRDSSAAVSASERIMVCIASRTPHSAMLLRRTSRLAGRLNTHWYVVYVETPKESPLRIDAEAQRRLIDIEQKTQELGGEFVRLSGKDPVTAMLEFARTHNVGHIVIDRTTKPLWRQLLGQSVMFRLVEEARGFDLHIVSYEGDEAQP
ncbi:MAG TPA: histidine kinase [Candidatus Binatia bacterium]|jgi:two-component system sensor histidine kinase KdpD